MFWLDDFSTDHFLDGRYAILAGEHGTDFGSGSFYLDVDGLHVHSVSWTDPTPIGSHNAYMELDVDSWSNAPFARIGFLPPGSSDWRTGLVFAFTRAGADAGLSIELFDQGTNIAHFYNFAATVIPPDSPLVLRLAIDDVGVAYMGAGCPGGFLPVGGSAPSLAGFGQISEDTLGAVASWVPYASISSSAGRRALKWQYGTAEALAPGELSAAAGANGILRSGPQPSTPGLRGSFQ